MLKFCLAFGLTLLGILYAHYTNKINKQKVVNKPRRLLPNVIKFFAFGLTVFSFWYAHYTNKINKHKTVNKLNCLQPNVITTFGQAFFLILSHFLILTHTYSYFLILSHTFSNFLILSQLLHTFTKHFHAAFPCSISFAAVMKPV